MHSKDDIVDEVRAGREAYAARFNFDMAEIVDDLKAKQLTHAEGFAKLAPVAPKPDTIGSW